MNKIYMLVGSYSLCWLIRHGCWCYWSKTKLRKTKTCVLMIISGTLVRLHLDLSPNPFWEDFYLIGDFSLPWFREGKFSSSKAHWSAPWSSIPTPAKEKAAEIDRKPGGGSWRSDGLLQKPSLLNATTIESVSLMLNPLSCSRNSRVVGGNPQTLKEVSREEKSDELGFRKGNVRM